MLALSKQFSRSPASPPHAQARGSVIQVNGTPHHRSSILEDKISYGDFSELEFGLNFLTYDQKDAYKCVFHRFEVPGKGLSRAGLVKALAELGHVPTTAEDSKRYARLQRNILKHTRLKAGDHESQELQNTPLDNPDGLWTYEEFLLMCEAMRELEGRNLLMQDQEISTELGIPVEEVGQLREVFHLFETDASGQIKPRQLRQMLIEIDIPTSDADFGLLLKSVGLSNVDGLDFKQFVMVAIQIGNMTGSTFGQAVAGGHANHAKPVHNPDANHAKTVHNRLPFGPNKSADRRNVSGRAPAH